MNNLIDVEEKDSIVLLRMKDKELGAEHAEELSKITAARDNKNTKGVIINFSVVYYMPSIFLSVLIEIMKKLKSKKIKLALAELNPKILEILHVTKLDTTFNIYNSSLEAYNALGGS